jgi:hypothetical protein
VTFNYDRSLEMYLLNTLRARWGRAENDVADLLRTFSIIHVHGNMGYVPWQGKDGGQTRDYTETARTARDIEIAANGIKIISESLDSSDEFEQAKKLMAIADRIVILGFGYHPVNMKRLNVPLDKAQRVYGTCFGMTAAQRNQLNAQHRSMIVLGQVAWNNMDFFCNQEEGFRLD